MVETVDPVSKRVLTGLSSSTTILSVGFPNNPGGMRLFSKLILGPGAA